jgi:hypothetical protein
MPCHRGRDASFYWLDFPDRFADTLRSSRLSRASGFTVRKMAIPEREVPSEFEPSTPSIGQNAGKLKWIILGIVAVAVLGAGLMSPRWSPNHPAEMTAAEKAYAIEHPPYVPPPPSPVIVVPESVVSGKPPT